MKTLKHPEYNTLPIYVAQSAGDRPLPGAFFVTMQTVPLSNIALKAYGSGTLSPTLRINKSKYNMQHCIYRYKSADCYSGKVSSTGAAVQTNWNPGAWLSLCNVDKNGQGNLGYGSQLGVKYQVIWVPPMDGKEPWDMEQPDDKVVGPIELPDVPDKTPGGISIYLPDVPDINIHVPGGGGDGGEGAPQPAPQKAGVPWWLAALLGGSALITMIVFAVKDKKKGKKRKKGSK